MMYKNETSWIGPQPSLDNPYFASAAPSGTPGLSGRSLAKPDPGSAKPPFEACDPLVRMIHEVFRHS